MVVKVADSAPQRLTVLLVEAAASATTRSHSPGRVRPAWLLGMGPGRGPAAVALPTCRRQAWPRRTSPLKPAEVPPIRS